LFFGCKRESTPCGKTKNTSINISTSSLNQTPYFTNPAFDTISFASDKGDTLIFVKTQIDSSWYVETEQGSPDCPNPAVNFYLTLNCNYTCILGNGNFAIKHSKREYGKSDNRIEIIFNSITFGINDYSINNKDYPTYIQKIYLGTKMYENVTRVTQLNQTGYIYLNKDYGCFFLNDLGSGLKWEQIEL
jgi:hypothetical protein